VLLGQFLELQRQPGLLDVEGGTIGRELMTRQQQIQQPVVRFSWLGGRDVEEEALVVSKETWGSDPESSTEDPPSAPPDTSLTKWLRFAQ
jgi:hypothetical protein